jgi:hypothetical protein
MHSYLVEIDNKYSATWKHKQEGVKVVGIRFQKPVHFQLRSSVSRAIKQQLDTHVGRTTIRSGKYLW